MTKCCIKQCTARKNEKHPQLTFHRIPKNAILKQKWLDIIGLNNINLQHKHWFVCSLHFEESSFNRTLGVIRLRENTVPLVLPSLKNNSSALSKQESKSHTQSYLRELQHNKSSTSTCEKLTANQSVLCESSNVQQAHCSAVTPPLQDVEMAIKEMRNTATIKKLSSTFNQLREKIKHLNEILRKRNKEIKLLENIAGDLKKTYSNKQSLQPEVCAGAESQDFPERKIVNRNKVYFISHLETVCEKIGNSKK